MSGGEIQVILNELNHVKSDLAEIKESVKNRCDNCVHVPTFRERLKSQWTHIMGLWAVIAAYAGYLLLKR